MAFDFPASPTLGQTYQVTGGPTYVWNGTAWQVLTPGSRFNRQVYTATAGQTTFNATYLIGGVDVFHNGVKLAPADFTASNGSTVVLVSAANAGDTIEVVSYSQVNYTNAVQKTGDTMTGDLVMSGSDIQLSAGKSLKYSATAYITPEDNVLGARISAPGTITLWTGTTPAERFRIDTSGNVGIGSSSPTNKLEVNAGTLFNAGLSSSKSAVRVTGAFGGGVTILDTLECGFFASDTGSNLKIFAGRNTSTETPNSKVAVTINSSGNVGIGTVSPGKKLEVAGLVSSSDTGTNQRFFEAKNSAGTVEIGVIPAGTGYLGTISNTPLMFYSNSAERARITAGGNIGINTNNPTVQLEVNGGIRAVGGGPGNAGYSFGGSGDTDGGMYSTADGTVQFFTNNTEKMRINPFGGVRINSTVYGSANDGKLIVCGGTGAWNERPIVVEHSGGDQPGIGFHAPSDSDAAVFKFYGPGNRFECRNSNDTSFVELYASACVSTSDYRLKENTTALSGGLRTVMQMKPYSFKWKDKDRSAVGFIAHEVQELIPTSIFGEKDAVDRDGKPVYQGVDPLQIVAVLVSAVQELSAKLDATEARIAQLEGTN